MGMDVITVKSQKKNQFTCFTITLLYQYTCGKRASTPVALPRNISFRTDNCDYVFVSPVITFDHKGSPEQTVGYIEQHQLTTLWKFQLRSVWCNRQRSLKMKRDSPASLPRSASFSRNNTVTVSCDTSCCTRLHASRAT